MNIGRVEYWNNGEEDKQYSITLFDPVFHHSSIPTFLQRLANPPEFWIMSPD
jgi:hypothetical protein